MKFEKPIDLFKVAYSEALKQKVPTVTPEFFFLALCTFEDSFISNYLSERGVEIPQMRSAIARMPRESDFLTNGVCLLKAWSPTNFSKFLPTAMSSHACLTIGHKRFVKGTSLTFDVNTISYGFLKPSRHSERIQQILVMCKLNSQEMYESLVSYIGTYI